MPAIRIEMLGAFRVTVDGRPVGSLHKGRLQSLLGRLALQPDSALPREQLAFTLWPDSTESQARTNLRQLIHHLRNALPEGCDLVESDTRSVGWRRSDTCSVDVWEFEAALAQAAGMRERRDAAAERKALESAAAVYQDDLLPGVYDDWLTPRRDRLREQLVDALQRLAALLADAGEILPALRHAERLVTLDSLRESHYRLLMELHARNGDRASALRAYHQCMRVLTREMGVSPGEATRQLFERVLKSDAASDAPEARVPASSTGLPMVGRRREWDRLRDCWQRAASGESLLALIAGEPGIGKSRLADELCQWCAQRGGPVARARCYAARGQLAYAPIEDWLKSEPLRAVTARLGRPQLEELARVCPSVLAEHPGLEPPRPLTDSWQRRHFFEALKVALESAAAPGSERPLLLVIDDLQWCDRDSFGWLHFFLTSGTRGVVVVGTVRPDEVGRDHGLASLTADLQGLGALEEIRLGPLNSDDASALAARVASRDLDPVYLARLYQSTRGNPLFVVESVRAKLEGSGSEDADVPLSALPRVQAVIAARLAQLAPGARELAGVAGAIGAAFSFDLLAKATDWDEDSVARALEELWQRRIVESVEERLGAGSYDFTHDRLREVAYAELSPVRRRYLHRRIARALEEVHAGDVDAVAGHVAAHCEAAGLTEEAVRRYGEAAVVAQRRYADAEAARLVRRALALCRELPQTPARDARELDLQVLLADVLLTVHGYAVPEAEQTHHRALELSQRLGETAHRGAILAAAAFFHFVRGELATATALSEQLAAFACGDAPTAAAAKPTADFMLGISLFHLGRLEEARGRLDEAWAVCADATTPLSLFGGLDMRVFCGSYRSHLLWLLGDTDGAARQSAAAVALARGQARPFSLALALDYAAMLRVFDRDPAGALDRAAESGEICRKYAFAYYLAWSEIVTGWARARQRETAEGLRGLQAGIENLKQTGAQLRLPLYYSLLAEAYDLDDQPRQALAAIATGLAFLNRTGERWTEAELHRVHGEVLERSDQRREAADSFRQAAEAARSVGAAVFENRAREALERIEGRGTAGIP